MSLSRGVANFYSSVLVLHIVQYQQIISFTDAVEHCVLSLDIANLTGDLGVKVSLNKYFPPRMTFLPVRLGTLFQILAKSLSDIC